MRGTIKRKREHEETDGYINQYGIADNKKEKLIRRDENSISVGVDRTKLWLRRKRKKREREKRDGGEVEIKWKEITGTLEWGEREREKKIEYNQVFDTVIEVVAYGYKVDTSA